MTWVTEACSVPDLVEDGSSSADDERWAGRASGVDEAPAGQREEIR